MNRLRGLLLCSVLVLVGCAGAGASPALFVLDQSYHPARAETAATAAQPTLVVDSVTIAPYLDGGGIVYQTAPYRVVVANNNRWASPLPNQLTDGLYATLTGQLDGISVQREGQPGTQPALHLAVHVDEFLGHYDGTAHIAGQWALVNADDRRIASRHFERHVPLDEDGYTALVASLSRGWRQTGRALVPELRDSLSPAE